MISAFVNFRKKNDKVRLFPGTFAISFTYIIQNIHLCQALSFLSPAFDTPIINSVSATESRANLIFVKYA